MTPREAAEALGLHPRTVLGWIKSGRCPAQLESTAEGPRYRVRLEDVQAAAEAPRRGGAGKTGDPARNDAPSALPAPVVDAVRPAATAAEVDALRAEVRDLRAQIHQVEVRLSEAIAAAAVRGPINRELRDLLLTIEKRLEVALRDGGKRR